jgi:hypothetical protein
MSESHLSAGEIDRPDTRSSASRRRRGVFLALLGFGALVAGFVVVVSTLLAAARFLDGKV